MCPPLLPILPHLLHPTILTTLPMHQNAKTQCRKTLSWYQKIYPTHRLCINQLSIRCHLILGTKPLSCRLLRTLHILWLPRVHRNPNRRSLFPNHPLLCQPPSSFHLKKILSFGTRRLGSRTTKHHRNLSLQ